jgi:hypothetical protein
VTGLKEYRFQIYNTVLDTRARPTSTLASLLSQDKNGGGEAVQKACTLLVDITGGSFLLATKDVLVWIYDV